MCCGSVDTGAVFGEGGLLVVMLAPAVWRREGREGQPAARWRDVFVRGSGGEGDCGSLYSLCRSAC